MNKILFFCDGGGLYGLGHVTRCLALAEELEENGYIAKFVINGSGVIPSFPYENYCKPELWPSKAAEYLCVVDSYAIKEEDIYSLWCSAKSCLWLDDENRRAYPGGVVVNPSLYGNELGYNNPGVRHLLGVDYIILRRAFRQQPGKAVNEKVNELTIIMGGTDTKNLLPEIADRLSVLVCKKNIISASSVSFQGYNMYSNLSAEEIAELFLQSDLVISAGGQTVNELIQMDTPAILIEAAKNQRININSAVKRGLAVTCMTDDIAGIVAEMDYGTREKLHTALRKYDFSNGVNNIIRSCF